MDSDTNLLRSAVSSRRTGGGCGPAANDIIYEVDGVSTAGKTLDGIREHDPRRSWHHVDLTIVRQARAIICTLR